MRIKIILAISALALLGYFGFKLYHGKSMHSLLAENTAIYNGQFAVAYQKALSIQDMFNQGSAPSPAELRTLNQQLLSGFKNMAWFREGIAAGRDAEGVMHPYGGVIRIPADVGAKLVATGAVPPILCTIDAVICESTE